MSLRVELLLTRKPLSSPMQRIYSADPEIPPHKIAINHNSSDSLRRRKHHAITAEVSVSPDKVIDVTTIADKTTSFLSETGVLDSPSDIMWTGHYDVHYAYPIYTHDRPGVVAEIKDWLEQHDIYTIGRFGEWEYINSDKCIAKGLALGKLLRDRYPSHPRRTPSGAAQDQP